LQPTNQQVLTGATLNWTIKETDDKDILYVSEMLYMESVNWVGQKKVDQDDHVKLIAIKTLADYIKKHCKGYSVNEVRKALKYGLTHDKTQGGHIYAQRLIFWLKNYDQNERPKVKRKEQPKSKPKQIEKPKMTDQEFIIYQFNQFKQKKYYQCVPTWAAMKRLKLHKEIYTDDEMWEFVLHAADKLLEEAKSGVNRFFYRQIKEEKKQLDENQIVSTRIQAEAARIAVENYFELRKET